MAENKVACLNEIDTLRLAIMKMVEHDGYSRTSLRHAGYFIPAKYVKYPASHLTWLRRIHAHLTAVYHGEHK